jgi:preprotein translocase subunit SecD
VAAPAPTPRPGRALAIILIGVVALYAWMFISGNTKPKLGIDLAGGTSLTLSPVVAPGETGTVTDTAVDQSVNILRQRVDGLGVAESSVTKQGSGANSTIVIEVPGQNDKDLYNKVGKTAKMSFRNVLLSGSPAPAATTTPTPTPSAKPTASAKATTSAKPTATASPTPTTSPSGAAGKGTISPADKAAYDKLDCTKPIPTAEHPADIAAQNLVTCAADGSEKYILGPQQIPGSDVSGAAANLDTGANGNGIAQWVVNLNFNGAGTQKFADVTRAAYAATAGSDANRFAVVLDGLVQTAPTVQSAIVNGQAQITGNFDQQSATDLANVLNYGALPLAFQAQQQQSISATLGSDQLYAGLVAGLIGLFLVVVYSLLYYRGLGLVTVASLTIAALLTYGMLCLLGQVIGYTLSLAGIAGAIVSIGITADSFVVLFERIRDEMRDGRTMRVAVESGWTRARRTILAADAVSFIAAVTLYLLAVGGVQGFAFTLGLTTIIDVVVVFLFTKPILTILARTKFFGQGHKWSGVDPDRLGVRRRTPSAPTSRRPVPKEA